MKVDMHEAKSQLPWSIRLARGGQELVIAKVGEPCLRIKPYRERWVRQKLGVLRGQPRVASDFDEPSRKLIKELG